MNCSFPECPNLVPLRKSGKQDGRFRGTLCHSHAKQKVRNGKLSPLRKMLFKELETCSISDCDNEPEFRLSRFCLNHVRHERSTRIANDEYEKCSVNGCSLLHYAKGLCKAHYNASRTTEVSIKLNGLYENECDVHGCHLKFYGNGKCKVHYDLERFARFAVAMRDVFSKEIS